MCNVCRRFDGVREAANVRVSYCVELKMRVLQPDLVTGCNLNLSKTSTFQGRYGSVTLYHGQMDCSQLMKMESGPS
jgi:hypothetical protein